MSYSENGNGTNFTMPVQPYGGAGYGGDFFGGNGAWWLIILLLFANNGWGNGFGFGGGAASISLLSWALSMASPVQSAMALQMRKFLAAMPRRMFSRLLTTIRLLLCRA